MPESSQTETPDHLKGTAVFDSLMRFLLLMSSSVNPVAVYGFARELE